MSKTIQKGVSPNLTRCHMGCYTKNENEPPIFADQSQQHIGSKKLNLSMSLTGDACDRATYVATATPALHLSVSSVGRDGETVLRQSACCVSLHPLLPVRERVQDDRRTA
jgi:hypothetical protein